MKLKKHGSAFPEIRQLVATLEAAREMALIIACPGQRQ